MSLGAICHHQKLADWCISETRNMYNIFFSLLIRPDVGFFSFRLVMQKTYVRCVVFDFEREYLI